MEESFIPEHIYAVNCIYGSYSTPLVYDRQGGWVWESGAVDIGGGVVVCNGRWAWVCFGEKSLWSIFSEKDILLCDAWQCGCKCHFLSSW